MTVDRGLSVPAAVKHRVRRTFSIRRELLTKSREAALAAIQLFNNPLVTFKSESFIVLIMIAWTYLLHSHYRGLGVEYRYFERTRSGRRRFKRTEDGSYRYWDLRQCLRARECPLDEDTKANLEFLIGLRDEITHRMCPNLDSYLSARYQACCMNFSDYLQSLSDGKFEIQGHVSYSIQLGRFDHEQAAASHGSPLLPNVQAYIARFDEALSEERFNSPRFAYRLVFTRKLVNHVGQADRVVEFVSPDSEAAQGIAKDRWLLKETERPKHLPGEIVAMMKAEGYSFTMHQHTQLWKRQSARDPTKGYGTELGKTWYWYDRWVEEVRRYCEAAREAELRRASREL